MDIDFIQRHINIHFYSFVSFNQNISFFNKIMNNLSSRVISL